MQVLGSTWPSFRPPESSTSSLTDSTFSLDRLSHKPHHFYHSKPRQEVLWTWRKLRSWRSSKSQSVYFLWCVSRSIAKSRNKNKKTKWTQRVYFCDVIMIQVYKLKLQKQMCISILLSMSWASPRITPYFLSQSVKRLSIVQSSIHFKIPIAVWQALLHNPYKLVWFAYCWALGSKASSNKSICLWCKPNFTQVYLPYFLSQD